VFLWELQESVTQHYQFRLSDSEATSPYSSLARSKTWRTQPPLLRQSLPCKTWSQVQHLSSAITIGKVVIMMAVVFANAAVSLKAFITESFDRHCGLRCSGLRSMLRSSVCAIAIEPAFAYPIIKEVFSWSYCTMRFGRVLHKEVVGNVRHLIFT
jgi:hypothetical protein